MMKKRIRINLYVFTCLLTFFALTALIPFQAEAVSMRYGGWELDGFLRNNTGVWTENWDYAENNDPLATCRNWFRLNLNGRITGKLKLKAEVLAIYEPEYSREHHGTEGDGTPIAANEYNYFDFRELRLDWRPAMGHDIRIGRQIVNWGESISARVGDVINPMDNRFDLGFTNLEDTRIPIWMIRGLHNFNSISSSIDWVFSPYMEPDRYRVTRQPSTIGHNMTNGDFTPGTRFAAYPATFSHMADSYNTTSFWVPTGLTGAYAFAPLTMVPGIPVLGAPFNRMYTTLPAGFDFSLLNPLLPAGLIVTPAAGQYILNGLDTTTIPADYPDSSLKDSRWGFKTSSTLAGYQTGVYFWNANEIDGTFKVDGLDAAGNYVIHLQFPRQNVYGWYANKNFDFGVLRLDAAYRPNREFNTLDQSYATGIVEKDKLMVQVGLNKDFMWRKLNPTASFSFVFEYVGDYFLEDTDQATVPSYFIEFPRELHSIFISGGTNYNFGMYAYGLTFLYNSEECGLIQPSFTYHPTWMNNKWQFKLQYSNVFGPDYAYPYGLMKEKDNVILTTQFTFP